MLDDVRVIDLSQYIPGPFATRQLADLGADVIKIEPPGGDPMRRFMHRECTAPSPVYQHLNRGKRVCELDLKSSAGRAALARLIEDADVLLESFRPGALERLGFAREQLEQLNPRLIHCALSGYGQTGPYAQRAGHDINYCALSSQSIVSGIADKPVIAYPPIADHASALQAAVSMLAALHARQKQETGFYLDVSISESILAWQYLPMLTGADERAAHYAERWRRLLQPLPVRRWRVHQPRRDRNPLLGKLLLCARTAGMDRPAIRTHAAAVPDRRSRRSLCTTVPGALVHASRPGRVLLRKTVRRE